MIPQTSTRSIGVHKQQTGALRGMPSEPATGVTYTLEKKDAIEAKAEILADGGGDGEVGGGGLDGVGVEQDGQEGESRC